MFFYSMEYFDGTMCFLYTMVHLNRSPPNVTIYFLYAMVPGAGVECIWHRRPF